jgi:hypothetical protein
MWGKILQATVFHAGIHINHELVTRPLEASLQNLDHKRGNDEYYAATSADNARDWSARGNEGAKVLTTEGIRSLTEPRQLMAPPVQPSVTKKIMSFLRLCRVDLVNVKGSTEVDRVYELLR